MRLVYLPLVPLVSASVACQGDKASDSGDTGHHADADADTDTDTDADTDADADADADTDADSDSDADSDADTDTAADTGTPPAALAVTVDNGDGTFTTEVDATDATAWTYLDLAAGAAVTPAGDPLTSADWDLAFRRDTIAVDGGISGAGGVEAVPHDHVPFEVLAHPAAGPYGADLPDADGDKLPEYAFAGWYDYDYVTHVLSPADRTWSVRDRHGATFRLRFDSYYDAAGVSGHPTFTWAPVPDPGPLSGAPGADGSFEATVVADDAAAPVHLRLASNLVVAPADPVTSAAWDLAIARTVITVGGGASGLGGVEVAVLPGADYQAVMQAPADGWVTDADTDGDGVADQLALGAWYDYDYVTHVVTPRDEVYVVRNADGEAFKLQIQAYDDGTHTARWAPVAP